MTECECPKPSSDMQSTPIYAVWTSYYVCVQRTSSRSGCFTDDTPQTQGVVSELFLSEAAPFQVLDVPEDYIAWNVY